MMMGTRPRAFSVALLLSVALASGASSPPHLQARQQVRHIRIAAAQNQPIKDGNGTEVGSLFVSTTGGRILNAPRVNLSVASRSVALLLSDEFSNGGRASTTPLRIEVEPEVAFKRIGEGKGYPTVRQTSADDSTGAKPPYALRDVVPTEDVRIADADGRTFAVLGLSLSGEPSVAFIDDTQRLQAVWSVGPVGNQVVKLFRQGHLRVLVTLLPRQRPFLSIFNPPYTDVYNLNADGTAQVPHRSPEMDELVWFSSATPAVKQPIALTDQGNALIWKSR